MLTPEGRRELDGVQAQLTDAGVLFHVSLPLDTLGLEARLGERKGSLAVPPGALVPGPERPSLRIDLDER